MDQNKIDKQFFGAFNIYHFNEADFNKEAFAQRMEEHRHLVNKYLAEFKVHLEGMQGRAEEMPDSDSKIKLMNEYESMVQIFSELEIEINKVWA